MMLGQCIYIDDVIEAHCYDKCSESGVEHVQLTNALEMHEQSQDKMG